MEKSADFLDGSGKSKKIRGNVCMFPGKCSVLLKFLNVSMHFHHHFENLYPFQYACKNNERAYYIGFTLFGKSNGVIIEFSSHIFI